MPCFYCGKRVSKIRQLTDADFCSDEHRKRYQNLTNVAFNRLMEAPGQVATVAHTGSNGTAVVQAPAPAEFEPFVPPVTTQTQAQPVPPPAAFLALSEVELVSPPAPAFLTESESPPALMSYPRCGNPVLAASLWNATMLPPRLDPIKAAPAGILQFVAFVPGRIAVRLPEHRRIRPRSFLRRARPIIDIRPSGWAPPRPELAAVQFHEPRILLAGFEFQVVVDAPQAVMPDLAGACITLPDPAKGASNRVVCGGVARATDLEQPSYHAVVPGCALGEAQAVIMKPTSPFGPARPLLASAQFMAQELRQGRFQLAVVVEDRAAAGAPELAGAIAIAQRPIGVEGRRTACPAAWNTAAPRHPVLPGAPGACAIRLSNIIVSAPGYVSAPARAVLGAEPFRTPELREAAYLFVVAVEERASAGTPDLADAIAILPQPARAAAHPILLRAETLPALSPRYELPPVNLAAAHLQLGIAGMATGWAPRLCSGAADRKAPLKAADFTIAEVRTVAHAFTPATEVAATPPPAPLILSRVPAAVVTRVETRRAQPAAFQPECAPLPPVALLAGGGSRLEPASILPIAPRGLASTGARPETCGPAGVPTPLLYPGFEPPPSANRIGLAGAAIAEPRRTISAIRPLAVDVPLRSPDARLPIAPTQAEPPSRVISAAELLPGNAPRPIPATGGGRMSHEPAPERRPVLSHGPSLAGISCSLDLAGFGAPQTTATVSVSHARFTIEAAQFAPIHNTPRTPAQIACLLPQAQTVRVDAVASRGSLRKEAAEKPAQREAALRVPESALPAAGMRLFEASAFALSVAPTPSAQDPRRCAGPPVARRARPHASALELPGPKADWQGLGAFLAATGPRPAVGSARGSDPLPAPAIAPPDAACPVSLRSGCDVRVARFSRLSRPRRRDRSAMASAPAPWSEFSTRPSMSSCTTAVTCELARMPQGPFFAFEVEDADDGATVAPRAHENAIGAALAVPATGYPGPSAQELPEAGALVSPPAALAGGAFLLSGPSEPEWPRRRPGFVNDLAAAIPLEPYEYDPELLNDKGRWGAFRGALRGAGIFK